MKKTMKFILKLMISLVFMAWLVFKIDWREAFSYAEKISIGQIVLYISVLLIGMMISSWKWKILAESKGFSLSVIRAFQLYLAGSFINNFMPSFIGGDTYRAYQLGKEEKRYIPAAASVVIDRTTGLVGAMVLSVIFAAFNWRVVANHEVLVLILGVVAIALAAVASMGIIMRFSFWKRISNFMPAKIVEIAKDFIEYKKSDGIIGKTMLLSILFSLVGLAGANYVLFSAMGIEVEVLNYLTVIFLISIVSALPVSINNIGIKEWAYVTFFGFFGVAASAVIAVALMSRIIQTLVSFAALPIYLKNKKTNQ